MPTKSHKKPGPQPYRAYLLRLWQEERDGHLAWRASLEDARTGERQGFADLALLYTFLAEQTAVDPQGPSAPA